MPQVTRPIWTRTAEARVSHALDQFDTDYVAKLPEQLRLLDEAGIGTPEDVTVYNDLMRDYQEVRADIRGQIVYQVLGPLSRADEARYLTRIALLKARALRFMQDVADRMQPRTTIERLPPIGPPVVAGGSFGSGGLLGNIGLGSNGIGGGSIGGTGHGFGGGGGPNNTGIPGLGGFGKRPGDDVGGLFGAPSVHGNGFQGNFGNGFFGSGFLHPGVGLGGGLTGGGTSPNGGGPKGKTGSGSTGGSYLDSTSRNDARGSGSDRDRGAGGTGSGGGVNKGDENAKGAASELNKGDENATKPSEVDKGDENATKYGPDDHGDDGRHNKHHLGGGGSEPIDGGGGDAGGNASESHATFTGFHPHNSGPAGGVTIGGGVHHLPGSPISYITATSDVGSIGGTTEGFGGTNPNVRVYRPDPEASGGGSGPRNPYFRPSEETGSPRGPSSRIARQVTVTSRGARTRLR